MQSNKTYCRVEREGHFVALRGFTRDQVAAYSNEMPLGISSGV